MKSEPAVRFRVVSYNFKQERGKESKNEGVKNKTVAAENKGLASLSRSVDLAKITHLGTVWWPTQANQNVK